MPLRTRVFQIAKDPEHPQEYQDACRTDPARGLAVIADGVSSSIFSAPWATLLTEALLTEPPDPDNPESFAAWLRDRRKQWTEVIDTSSLAWFQRAKLPQGAFSTLLWITVQPADDEAARNEAFGSYRLRGHAIGDSCLFHIRGSELVRTFPMQHSADFQADPIVLGSVDLKRDQLLTFARLDEFCYPDDLLVLCTDALAEWALRRYEENDPPDWDACWNVSDEDWASEIVELRQRRELRYDDTTLALIGVMPQEAAAAPPLTKQAPAKQAPPRRKAEPAAEEAEAEVEAEAEPASADSPLDFLNEDAVRKVKSVSEQMAKQIDQTSEEVFRTVQKLGKKAWEKYRDKFRPKDK